MKAPKGSPLDKALKRRNVSFIIWLLVAVVSWVVTYVLYSMQILPGLMGVVAFVAFAASCGTLSALSKKDIKRQYCLSCGQRYDDYDYEVIEEINSGTKLEEVVEFTLECEECGDSRTFTQKFTVATIDSKGNIKRQNLDKLIAKYFGQM